MSTLEEAGGRCLRPWQGASTIGQHMHDSHPRAAVVRRVARWGVALARYELGLLEELGFGLDFSRCAATGETEDLLYVSPKSGRAVSRLAGEPYKDRLFTLPQFLKEGGRGSSTMGDIIQALNLTGSFLMTHVLEPKNEELPEARRRLVAQFTRNLSA